jgi:hypothetical protein
MTFLQQLQAHKGGLVRLKTLLYWYDGVRNEIVGRICMLLDAAATAPTAARSATAVVAVPVLTRDAAAAAHAHSIARAALLLIDGSPQWIWITEADVELL